MSMHEQETDEVLSQTLFLLVEAIIAREVVATGVRRCGYAPF